MHKQMEKSATTTAFEVGQTYLMGWIGDSELKTPYVVVHRTAKFVTVQDPRTGETNRCKVHVYEGIEQCYPTGQYSMCPSLKADKLDTRDEVLASDEVEAPKENAPKPIIYKGYEIVPSTKIDGWYMTTCGSIVGESIQEVKYDIDNPVNWEALQFEYQGSDCLKELASTHAFLLN